MRHNVIKAGLRKINTSYSRISFADICKKLHLDSVEDCQYIVAKTIKDGVIDAVINHEGGYIQSRETIDVYSTEEPQVAFNRRIEFCLKIHNDAVKVSRWFFLFLFFFFVPFSLVYGNVCFQKTKAMRFPEDQKPVLETDKEIRKRESEIAKGFEEEDEDF